MSLAHPGFSPQIEKVKAALSPPSECQGGFPSQRVAGSDHEALEAERQFRLQRGVAPQGDLPPTAGLRFCRRWDPGINRGSHRGLALEGGAGARYRFEFRPPRRSRGFDCRIDSRIDSRFRCRVDRGADRGSMRAAGQPVAAADFSNRLEHRVPRSDPVHQWPADNLDLASSSALDPDRAARQLGELAHHYELDRAALRLADGGEGLGQASLEQLAVLNANPIAMKRGGASEHDLVARRLHRQRSNPRGVGEFGDFFPETTQRVAPDLGLAAHSIQPRTSKAKSESNPDRGRIKSKLSNRLVNQVPFSARGSCLRSSVARRRWCYPLERKGNASGCGLRAAYCTTVSLFRGISRDTRGFFSIRTRYIPSDAE